MGQFESFFGVNFWTAFFVLLNTLAVFFVAKKFLFKPVMNMIQQRQDEIDGMYSDADSAKSEAQAMQAQYEKQLSQAHVESDRLVKEAVARGRNREEEIIRQANAQASHIKEKAEQDITMERRQMLLDVKGEISEIAVSIASKVVEREIQQKDHEAFMDEFIKNVGDPS